MGRDFDATLATVAEIGYDEVEFAGYFDRSPAQVRAALDRNGLTSPATHIGLNEIQADPARVFAAAAEIGQRYVVVPSLGRGQRDSLDALQRTAAALNEAGRAAASAGVRVGFHNHDVEFREVEGVRPFDVLLRETDPNLVWFEMDLFWITRGGGDPFTYFERWPGRFPLVHVKDMDNTPQRGMVEVGKGTIDFAAIFARAEQAGIQHYFVEHDNPADPIASIRASYAHLKTLEE
jgi:sugar phosphate isomerase/epimerase